MLDSSIISTFLGCRAFVPGMKGTGYGRIINLTSMHGHISLPGRTAYSSAKTALLGFTRAAGAGAGARRASPSTASVARALRDADEPRVLMNDPGQERAVPGIHPGRPLGQGGRDRRHRLLPLLGTGRLHHRHRLS